MMLHAGKNRCGLIKEQIIEHCQTERMRDQKKEKNNECDVYGSIVCAVYKGMVSGNNLFKEAHWIKHILRKRIEIREIAITLREPQGAPFENL
jgi:predicted secreted protein